MTSPNEESGNAQSEVPTPERKEVPKRFLVSKKTLYFDRFMTSAIVFGGLGVIVAVFGIFAFILSEILPLFGKAHVELAEEIEAGDSSGEHPVLGMDEWSELPFVYDGTDKLIFTPSSLGVSEGKTLTVELPEGAAVSRSRYDAVSQKLILGTADGRLGHAQVKYDSTLNAEGRRVVTAEVETQPFFLIQEEGAAGPVRQLDYADSGQRKIYAAIHGEEGATKLGVLFLEQSRSILGGGTITAGERTDLTPLLDGQHPVKVIVAGTADSAVVTTKDGEIFYLFKQPAAWEVRQRFKPFEDEADLVAGVDFLFGDVSLVTHSHEGRVRMYSLFIAEGAQMRTFGLTKEFPKVEGGVKHYVASQRNKSFVLVGEKEMLLCYATTASVRNRVSLPETPVSVAIDGKFEHVGLLGRDGQLSLYDLDDHHPEAGWKAFFGKVWYEGFAEPKYEWQSTGGTDDFEPKLSLTPLIIGSLKGTIYAMLFAVPIALLAAIYVSQFAHPEVKKTVKPLMEIMASLPSVVLGFLAALWLAPLIETKVPSVLAIVVLLPLAAGGIGFLWSHMPIQYRNSLPRGAEFMILIPVVFIVFWAGWNLGPVIESWFFVATMPDGERIADFRLWWPQFSGTPYDQRNCLVVGFMMGFAVIPVIFTIAEDALSNVPPSITSASEALGASRWQVVRTIVIPIAAAGMFSALMIGFGRAVGETMIVVMATGNTPVMDESGSLIFGEFGLGGGKAPVADHWNIFNGMRTLSANIAVELPEAPVHSTHYRALFLGAMVLFILTFALNTVAEILRQRLRDKFKIV